MSESTKPVPKVAAAGSGGVAATLLITLAQALGVELPPEVAAGIVAVVAFAAGYLKR
jgi:hypothetical protein